MTQPSWMLAPSPTIRPAHVAAEAGAGCDQHVLADDHIAGHRLGMDEGALVDHRPDAGIGIDWHETCSLVQTGRAYGLRGPMPRLATAGSPALPVCARGNGRRRNDPGRQQGRVDHAHPEPPDKLNSFNEAMHAELRTALEHCAADPGCRRSSTGAGRAFSAGQDLSDPAMSADEGPPDPATRWTASTTR